MEKIEEKILSALIWLSQGRKKMVAPGKFNPGPPKCIAPNWRENQEENERRNPNGKVKYPKKKKQMEME